MVIIVDTHFVKCYYGFEDVEYIRNDIFKALLERRKNDEKDNAYFAGMLVLYIACWLQL